jgi:hypothetical protein
MFGGEALVVLLSVVPLVENRGAMFVGFALGITSPYVYALSTIANIAAIPFWEKLIGKLPFPLRKVRASPAKHIPILVALPYNGVNMATVLYFFPKFFRASMDEVRIYLALGIALRGAVTYLFLVGLMQFLDIWQVAGILVAWYALTYLAGKLGRKK